MEIGGKEEDEERNQNTEKINKQTNKLLSHGYLCDPIKLHGTRAELNRVLKHYDGFV